MAFDLNDNNYQIQLLYILILSETKESIGFTMMFFL